MLFAFASNSSIPSATLIVQRCGHAYDQMKSLDETVRATSNNFPSTARILYSRPGRLKITGTTMFGSAYTFAFDGIQTWVLLNGNWVQQETPFIGLELLAGVSGGAATTLPEMLEHSKAGGVKDFAARGAKVSTAMLNGRKAFRIDVSKPFQESLWVDSQKYLLLRYESFQMKTRVVEQFDAPRMNVRISARTFARG